MENETSFVAIATAVGLAEREMEPRIDRYQMRIFSLITRKTVCIHNNNKVLSSYGKKFCLWK